MIRIKPYSELQDSEKAFHIYLYNVACALPFPIEDIFIEGKYWDPNNNTYCFDLNKFKTGDDRTKNLLGIKKQIEKYSKKLAQFLFLGDTVNRRNLRTLLTTPMDEESLKKNMIWEILEEVDQKKPENSKDLLENVFRYSAFSSSKRKGNIYDYVKMLGVEVCPYCNRMFTSTIDKTETDDSKSRPQLDHYRNKDTYPFLALSILNLVPSCGVCNLIKWKKPDLVLYPFQEELGKSFCFRTNPIAEAPDLRYLTGNSTDFTVELKQVDFTIPDEFADRSESSIRIFRLNDFYQHHVAFLSDLFLQRYVFSDDYCKDIKNRFPDLFTSVQDVKRLLYLRSIEQADWGQRPLSKLTHDIDEEISDLNKISILHQVITP